MQNTDPRSVVLAFVSRINAGDVDGIAALLTDDHEFIDTAGMSFRGRETLREGWAGYFQLFPDYHIHAPSVRVESGTVTLVGTSTGTLTPFGEQTLRRPDGTLPAPNQLQGPAIWTACVEDGLIAQWRVCSDTADVRAALGIPA
ncbi:MAG: nuclear transport factor 2 family protein [Dehalococcoidia bacterium]